MRNLILVFSLLLCGVTIGNSQSTILKILGKHNYTPEKEGSLIEVEFIENINVCDPVHGYRTLEDMEHSFDKTLKSKGISFKKFKKEDNICKIYGKEMVAGIRKSIFQYVCTSNKEVKDVYSAAQINFAEEIKVNDKYSVHKFEEEDVRAVAAIKDAKERAAYIAKGLDMEISEILNIDDLTSNGISSYLSDIMMRMDIGSDMFGSRSYGIWVTFELNPI